jgi:hypothetical protein
LPTVTRSITPTSANSRERPLSCRDFVDSTVSDWPKAGVRVAGDAGAIALSPIVAGVEKVRQAVKTHAAANLTSWI